MCALCCAHGWSEGLSRVLGLGLKTLISCYVVAEPADRLVLDIGLQVHAALLGFAGEGGTVRLLTCSLGPPFVQGPLAYRFSIVESVESIVICSIWRIKTTP